MITLTSVFVLLGFWCCYQTSARAVLTHEKNVFVTWIRSNPKGGRLTGLFILSLSLTLEIIYLGIGAGIFAFFIALMTFGSLVVVLAPLRLIKYQSVGIVTLISILLELTLK